MGGLERAPKPPESSERPGGAVSLLWIARVMGASNGPPKPKCPGAAVSLVWMARAMGASNGSPTPPDVRSEGPSVF